ncbi:hypothetical protein [Planctomicrobium piriforme]|uniref:Uncharacterized protein n=1 Tax=Planctomicrobium piriforme TaxID=1576369 RepID=A0A1I3FI03_9PLAN|nr:hypothetical protein [Planctomicrobium piriforme]SFI10840.1 hypothetical protein SAMN05421753_105258 [Planctomicrobium piriforme]
MAKKLTLSAMVFCLFCALPASMTQANLSLGLTIKSIAGCSDYLNISARHIDGGMVEYVVRIDPERIAPEKTQYKGRLRAHAQLEISSADSLLADIRLEPTVVKSESEFRFRINATLVEHSRFTVSTILYGEDGVAIVGGGTNFRIVLKGFLPSEPSL